MTRAPALVRRLGRLEYERAEPMMRSFTASRHANTPDEIWLVEHPPVYTLGRAARLEHVRDAGSIPVVRTERGGQVTYHGPGQAVCYVLVDLRRGPIRVRDFVDRIEATTIALLERHGIAATRHAGAPGVYVQAGAKIASIGVRITEGRSWHGVALNVAMDLEPFSRIDPCGYPGLAVTDMRSWSSSPPDFDEVGSRFAAMLACAFIPEPAPRAPLPSR